MEITKEQLDKKKTKKVGTYHGQDVLSVATKGGLYLLMSMQKNGELKTLGAGPHPAIARSIARRENPDFVPTELSKGEELPQWLIDSYTEEYTTLTKKFNE